MISLPSRLLTASLFRPGRVPAASDSRRSTVLAAAVCLLAALPCARAQITAHITSPPENISVVSGQPIQLAASVRDPAGMAEQIQFSIIDLKKQQRPLLQFPLTGPYVRDFILPTHPGSYQLVLNVTDVDGNLTTDRRTLTVVPASGSDPIPDTALLTDLAGRTIQAGATIVLTAVAESLRTDGGQLGRVDFYADNTRIASYDGAGKPITAAAQDGFHTSAESLVDENGPATNGSVFSGTWFVPSTNGFVNLTTVATTKLGRSRVSNVVPVQVTTSTANEPPNVSILNITNGDRFPARTSLNIPVTASDPDRLTRSSQPGSIIARAENYVNETRVNTPISAPFGFPYTLTGVGTYVINSIATDGLGLSTVAAPVIIRSTGVMTVALVKPTSVLTFEGGATHQVQVVRSGDLSKPLTVRYRTSGNAVSGRDYTPLSGTVTFPAGATQAVFKVHALSGRDRDDNRTLTFTLQPSSNGAYVLGPIRRFSAHLIATN